MSANTELRRQSLADHNIADPGASGTIPTTRSGICHLVSAGVESRTLAAPYKAGLEVAVVGKTIAGTVTVTIGSSGSYTEASDTDFQVTAAGQFMLLRSFEIAAGTFAWRKIASDGIGSSTVALASEISIADGGSYTAAANVEDALQDIYAGMVASTSLGIPMAAITAEDGTALTLQTGTTTGYVQLADKNVAILIPAASDTPTSAGNSRAFSFNVKLPSDFNSASPLTMHVITSKGSNTDTLTLDAEFYLLDSATLAWSADCQETAAIAVTQAAKRCTFTVASPVGATDNPSTLAAVIILSSGNSNDAVYIHDVYLGYSRLVQ